MKKYYISTQSGLSGICKYSFDFYQLVLKNKEYIFIDSSLNLTNILTRITSADHVHIEIGIFQRNEIKILIAMLDANYKNVSITMHDPPLLKYPFSGFRNPFLNNISKFYDIYIDNFKHSSKYINKIKTIYVLSKKGVELVKQKYKIDNVRFIPHIINEAEIEKSNVIANNFMYLGFIGKNKNIEYALQLHKRLIKARSDINFYVIGTSTGKNQKYYDFLKEKYVANVHFLGYIPENNISEILKNISFSIISFKSYKFYCPVSGSLLYSLKKGIIPFVNKVNSIEEFIRDGSNGKYLSGDLNKDTKIITGIIDGKKEKEYMKNEIYKYLLFNHVSSLIELDDTLSLTDNIKT